VATERVVTHLGPGSARDVIAELLKWIAVKLCTAGSSADSSVLSAWCSWQNRPDANPNTPQIAEQQPGMHTREFRAHRGYNLTQMVRSNQENTDDAADQAAAERNNRLPLRISRA